jgi:hypothetical protein
MCGCKKKRQVQEKPKVNVSVRELSNQNEIDLTTEEQKQVNKIISKIEKLSS